MKPSITQRYEMSCGLACISFVTDKPYDLLILDEKTQSLNKTGFSCIGLVRRLGKLGFQYSWRKITDTRIMDDFPIGAIVFVGRSNDLPHGHWLARSEHSWMDSWVNWQENSDIKHAQSGFRMQLPGKPEFVLLPIS